MSQPETTWFLRFYGVGILGDIETRLAQCLQEFRALGYQFTDTVDEVVYQQPGSNWAGGSHAKLDRQQVGLQFPTADARDAFVSDARTSRIYQQYGFVVPT